MPLLRILLIGNDNTLTDATRAAWSTAGILIEGPVAADRIDRQAIRTWAGVLIDIAAMDDGLSEATEWFDRQKVPYLFVVKGPVAPAGPQPYVLGPDPVEIAIVMKALLEDGQGIVDRH